MARPRSALIQRDTAVRAALAVIDEHGLDAFSLALVAKALNVKAPSLYHHFRDKSEVLAEVARLIMLEAEEPKRLPADDWKEALVSLAISARRSILRHPNAAPLLLMYPPRHVVLRAYERSLRVFEKKGVPREKHMLITIGMDNILLGSALTAAYSRSQNLPNFPVYDPAEFPSLAAATKANPYQDDEAAFIAAMRAYLAGIENGAAAKTPKVASA
jgi:AcrR family transcriptional regulator